MSNNHFSALDSDKVIAEHISTTVPFKITIRNRHVYTDIRLRWIWTSYSSWDIWNDNRTKMLGFFYFGSLHY